VIATPARHAPAEGSLGVRAWWTAPTELRGGRSLLDIQGDLATEAALATLLDDGELQRHVARVRRIYADRRAILSSRLRRAFGDSLDFTLPSGGMALWVRVRMRVDVDAWARRALDRGVSFYTGRRYAFDGRPRPFVRLGFAWLDERELAEAVRRMASAVGPSR